MFTRPAMARAVQVVARSGCACGDGGVLPVWSIRDLVPLALQLDETSGQETLGEDVNRPAVGGDDLVVERGYVVIAVEEADDQQAGGGEEPAELGEDAVEFGRRQVDGRVPREDAGNLMVRNVQLGHRAEPETRAGVGRASVGDELRNHVDARHVSAQGVQVGGPVTGAAAEVEHWSRKPAQVPPHQGGVIVMVLPVAVEQADVLLGHGRVRVTHWLDGAHHFRLGPAACRCGQLPRDYRQRHDQLRCSSVVVSLSPSPAVPLSRSRVGGAGGR